MGIKKTSHEKFMVKVKEKYGDEYDYSKTIYNGAHEKITVICHVHGVFQIKAGEFIRKRREKGCPICGRMFGGKNRAKTLTLTIDGFIKRAIKVHGDRYDYSKSIYKNNKEKIEIICPIHGSYWQEPRAHLSGSGCQECGGCKILTTKEFVEKAVVIHGNKYGYSRSIYNGSNVKICIYCRKCKKYFTQSPSCHLSGAGCLSCKKISFKDFELFLQNNKFIKNTKFIVFDTEEKYKDSKTRLNLIDNHGYRYYISYHDISRALSKNTIPSRFGNGNIYAYENIKKYLKLNEKPFSFTKKQSVSSYKQKIEMVCHICNDKFDTNWNYIQQGNGCPSCKHSKGELKVSSFLKSKSIKFKGQYRFTECKNKNSLPFDFCLFKDNKMILIEYDGQHHFEPVCFGGISVDKAKENFKKTKINDAIKTKYCEDNGIKLIRIPYWEFENIEEILKRELCL